MLLEASQNKTPKTRKIRPPGGPLKCPHCEKGFHKKFWLTEHIRTHTEALPFACPHCQLKFARRPDLTEHQLEVHGHTKFECPVCGKEFDTRSRLEDHSITHTDERPFSCEICKTRFKREFQVKRHMLVQHSGQRPERRFSCAQCGYLCENRSKMRRHELSHSKERPYKCEQCDKTFKYVEDRNSHFKKVHEGSAAKRKFQCEVCDFMVWSQSQLERHRLTHSTERRFVCEICSHPFKFPDELAGHRRIFHPSDLPEDLHPAPPRVYRRHKLKAKPANRVADKAVCCIECCKQFKNSKMLQKHVALAHKRQEKPPISEAKPKKEEPQSDSLVCGICEQEFDSRQDLTTHLECHTISDES